MIDMIIRHAREEDAAGIATVQVETWQSAYVGLIPQEHLDALDISKKAEQWRKQIKPNGRPIFVAEYNGKVIGFIAGGESRSKELYDGEITVFYVLEEYQGNGIGTKLFETMKEEFKRIGYNSFYLWVLHNGGARKFYEKIGGIYIDKKIEKMGNIDVVEVSYGWENNK